MKRKDRFLKRPEIEIFAAEKFFNEVFELTYNEFVKNF